MTLEKWLKELVKENLRNGLFVWYDPLASFAPIVDKMVPPKDVKLLKFEGSYLALRFKLEDEDPEFKKTWVVYIPAEETDFLKDWGYIGRKQVLSLPELLLAKGRVSLSTELMNALAHNSATLVKHWNRLIGEKEPTAELIQDALLATAFNLLRWDEGKAILKFIINPHELAEQLQNAEVYLFWLEKLKDLVEVENENPQKIRDKLLKALFFGELVYMGAQSKDIFTLLPKLEARYRCCEILRTWRSDIRFKDAYLSAVEEVSSGLNLKEHLQLNEELLEIETFPEIDDAILDELLSSINSENYEEKVGKIQQIADKRSEMFWAQNQRIKYWKPLHIAARLFQGCNEAMKACEQLDRDGVIERYVKKWWEFDRQALELSVQDLGRESPLVQPAKTAYQMYLDKVNRRLLETVKTDGWTQNHTSFWSYVARMEKPVVVFFTDAFRFDLAKILVEKLEIGVEEAHVEWLYGVLPSITEVGMAALLPDAELTLALDGALKVSIGDSSVTGKSERVAYLKNKGISVTDFDSTEIPKAEILVVMMRDIDRAGEMVDIAPQNLLEIVDKLSRRILKLREDRFRSIVLGADHGFLCLNEGHERVPCKGELVKWRFAINTLNMHFIVKPEDLGLKGDLLLSVPAGSSIFGVPGEAPQFVHGGLSLQETVIPVVTLKLAMPSQKVKVNVEYPETITSRIVMIKLSAAFDKLNVEPRRLYCEVNTKKSNVITLAPGKAETIRVNWLSPMEEPPEEIEIKVVDDDAGTIISKKKIKVRLLV